jgi:hypothetical protein
MTNQERREEAVIHVQTTSLLLTGMTDEEVEGECHKALSTLEDLHGKFADAVLESKATLDQKMEIGRITTSICQASADLAMASREAGRRDARKEAFNLGRAYERGLAEGEGE